MCASAGVCHACKDGYGLKGTECEPCLGNSNTSGCEFCPDDYNVCCRCSERFDLVEGKCKP